MGACSRFIWSIIWFLMLFFVSFIVAGFSAGLYIFISVFTPCCKGLDPIQDFFLKGVNFPHTCSRNMVLGNSYSKI